MAKKTTQQLLNAWQNTWEANSKINPFCMRMEEELNKIGFSIYDIKTELAIIKSKKTTDLNKYEALMLQFYDKTLCIAEVAKVDVTSSDVKGVWNLLKSKHGYSEKSELDVNIKADVVMSFGDIVATDE